MPSIIFTRHPEQIEIDAENAVCIYHKVYQRILPQINNCQAIEFKYLCDHFQSRDFFAGKDTVVFVGANKFFTPSTRFHPVFEVLQYGLPGLKRYSIDIAPYVGPLWRLWGHWSFAGLDFGGYTYSYLLESHYNAFLEGVREDNPLSLDKIRRYAAEHIQIDYDRYFVDPEVTIIQTWPDVKKEYAELKGSLFDRYDAIAPIIRGLAQFAQGICPERYIPQEYMLFDKPDRIHIIRTDLKVDEYLTNKLLAKIKEVNAVVEVLQER